MARTCKKGEIRVRGHTKKNGRRVRSYCTKDRGVPGKGKRLFTLKKGGLTKYGYSLKKGAEDRVKALRKAMNAYSYATLVRKLNVLSILHKNTNKTYASRARKDLAWVQKHRK